MKIKIVTPWRPGDAWRQKSFDFCQQHYRNAGFETIAADSPQPEFNRSAARNHGAELAFEADADVLAFIDADAYIPNANQILEAAQIAVQSKRMVKPFSMAGFLTESSTANLYETNQVVEEWINPPTHNFIGLGWVIPAAQFLRVGGFDEAFVGYGGEDNAFHTACELLLGPVTFVDGPAYSLYHPGECRQASQETWERTRQYWAIKSELEYWSLRNAT